MRYKKVFVLLLLVYAGASAQRSYKLTSNLEVLKPINIFPEKAQTDFVLRDGSKADKKATFEGKTDKDGNTIFTAEVFTTAKSHYDVNVKWICDKPLKKGDVILAKLTMRALYARQESGEAVVNFYMSRRNYDGDKSIIIQLGAGPEWKEYDIPFTALTDMPAGEGEIFLSLGALSQKVEIKDLIVLNFENKISLEKLPVTRFTYLGREKNAAWRTQALKKIEEIRTAPIDIHLTDSKGIAVKGAKVEVKMKTSEFIWGTAVNEEILAEELPDSKEYKKNLLELFNTAVIENGFKGGSWKQNEKKQQQTIKAFEWLEKNGFRQRGHNLVWPAWKFNPARVKTLAENDPKAFEKYIEDEIREKTSILKGRVIGWDVVNELVHEKEFFAYLPKDIEVKWFQIAKSIDPQAQMFINEYGMLNSIASPNNIKEYVKLISDLRTKGAPIDAIGIQGHVGRQPRNPEQVISDLELFKSTGLPVQITEFDINMKDEELQADYTRDFLIACYSSPVVTGFTIWGFWEPKHWKPDAAMFRKDWTAKPNAQAWRDLVTKEWKTNFIQESDSKGHVSSRGHFGLYEITVTNGSVVKKVMYQLSKESRKLEIKL
ncbi:endo-1,4-beta-xylanase [Flavobacterium sp. 3-210]